MNRKLICAKKKKRKEKSEDSNVEKYRRVSEITHIIISVYKIRNF